MAVARQECPGAAAGLEEDQEANLSRPELPSGAILGCPLGERLWLRPELLRVDSACEGRKTSWPGASGRGVPQGTRARPDWFLLSWQLSGTPAGGQGSLITYSLFLKTPVHGNGQYITTPRKKIFSPRNLKLTLFNSDIC